MSCRARAIGLGRGERAKENREYGGNNRDGYGDNERFRPF